MEYCTELFLLVCELLVRLTWLVLLCRWLGLAKSAKLMNPSRVMQLMAYPEMLCRVCGFGGRGMLVLIALKLIGWVEVKDGCSVRFRRM
jgi:hypothetical protein